MLAEASLFAGAYHCDALVREDATATRFTLSSVLGACEDSPPRVPQAGSEMAHDGEGERLLLRLAELADEEGQLPENLVMRDIAAEIGATPEAT